MSKAFSVRFFDVLWHALTILWVGSAWSLTVILPILLAQLKFAPLLADSLLRAAWLAMVFIVWLAITLQVLLHTLVERLRVSVWTLQCLAVAVLANAAVLALLQADSGFWLRYSTWVVAAAGVAFVINSAHKKSPQ